jgi:hypothetical protein
MAMLVTLIKAIMNKIQDLLERMKTINVTTDRHSLIRLVSKSSIPADLKTMPRRFYRVDILEIRGGYSMKDGPRKGLPRWFRVEYRPRKKHVKILLKIAMRVDAVKTFENGNPSQIAFLKYLFGLSAFAAHSYDFESIMTGWPQTGCFGRLLCRSWASVPVMLSSGNPGNPSPARLSPGGSG